MQKAVFILLTITCLLQQVARAQNDASVRATISTSKILVGERADLDIELRHNNNKNRLEWSIPDTFNTLEVLSKNSIDTIAEGEFITYKQQIQLTGFDSGVFVIPPFNVTVIPVGADTPYLIQTNPLEILVETVAVDTTQGYKGIKEIIIVEPSWRDYIGWITGGSLILVALAALIYYLARKKSDVKPAPAPVVPKETMQEKYYRLLQELEQQQLWQNNQVKEYYVTLTDILRNYIEERFHTPALELTTDEILDKARKNTGMRSHLYLLEQILRTADLAKFAKANPLPHEHASAMDATRRFITLTLPENTEVKPKS